MTEKSSVSMFVANKNPLTDGIIDLDCLKNDFYVTNRIKWDGIFFSVGIENSVTTHHYNKK
jgi:hypothetical protein